ncbi:MAG TPA: type II toxin-antitoxin system RelE/ParE family toxin [Elusimicrobiota bacterium]|nr:type II toxin-antitoxin system RelE/ParE family toxin [Elusimicrobiota bacterium]
MVEVRWTLQASQDLDSIAEFIAKDSPQYASLFVVDILQAVDRISAFPQSGRIVPELGDPIIREIIMGNYRLVYRCKARLIELLTVYHGSRLLDPGNLK